MARSIATPTVDTGSRSYQKPGFPLAEVPLSALAIDEVGGGMVRRVQRSKIPASTFYTARNARVTSGDIRRRPGSVVVGTKLNSNRVLKLVTYVDTSLGTYLIRVDTDGLAVYTELDWSAYPAIDFDEHRIQVAPAFGYIYFCDGNRLKELDPINGTTQRLSSPYCTSVAAFADRIVVGNESTIYWSDNRNPRIWNGDTSGEETLLQGSSDFSDHISAIVPYGNVAFVIRQRTIWLAERQASGQAPLRFTNYLPIGCDMPGTVVATPLGIIFADARSKGVYLVKLDGGYEMLNEAPGLREVMFEGLLNSAWAEATYDWVNMEYHLGLPKTGDSPYDITETWVFGRGAWTYDDGPVVSTLGVVAGAGGLATIDGLVGSIDSLVPHIDDLGGGAVPVELKMLKGLIDGDVIAYDEDYNTDSGASFEFELASHDIGSATQRRTLKELGVKVETSNSAVVQLSNGKQRGTWRDEKEATIAGREGEQLVRLNQAITGNNLFWRLTCSTGKLRVLGWWAEVLEKSRQR